MCRSCLPMRDTRNNSNSSSGWRAGLCSRSLVLGLLALLYRYGPCRPATKWQWVSAGAVFATVVWLLASAAFSFYVANFGRYDATYGSLGAVIVLLFWFYLSFFIVLLGAEINAERELWTGP